jgi:hypothetical protein
MKSRRNRGANALAGPGEASQWLQIRQSHNLKFDEM